MLVEELSFELEEFDYSSLENRLENRKEEEEELDLSKANFKSFEELKFLNDKKRVRKIIALTKELSKLCKKFRNEYRPLAITLTFKNDEEFIDFYNNRGMRSITDNIRKYVYRKYGRRDVFYLWVVELQKRGVFHFHILLVVPRGVYIPFLDKWFFEWGMTNIKELKGFGKYYLAKYLAKSKREREEEEVDNDKSYQVNYELMREKKKALRVNQRFLGYSMKILHEVLRYQLDKLRYIKWFLNRVASFPMYTVYKYHFNENEKGFWFWGYRLYSMKKVFSFSELLGWLRCNFKHFALLPS